MERYRRRNYVESRFAGVEQTPGSAQHSLSNLLGTLKPFLSLQMDFQKIAGDVLFGGPILDNAVRGLFIEAVVIRALQQYQGGRKHHRWCFTGYGWKPWDLQRGAAAYNTRVRVQVKAKAAEQLWVPKRPRKPSFDLGWKKREKLPSYFERDMDEWYFGKISKAELRGYLCDIHLLAWHGPLDSKPTIGNSQSDPNNYRYFVVPSSMLDERPSIQPHEIAELGGAAADFAKLPHVLDAAADDFLASRQPNYAGRLA